MSNLTSGSSSGVSSTHHDFDNVKITEIASSTEFTVQKTTMVDSYKLFMKKIKKQAESAEIMPDSSLEVATTCLAWSTITSQWHRVEILDFADSTENDYLVSCKSLDDGTTFCVTDPNNLRKINVKLSVEPAFCQKCALPIHAQLKMEDSITKQMMKDVDKVQFNSVDLANHGKLRYIELIKENMNLVDKFVEQGLCTRIFVVPEGKAKVLKYESVENFVIRMESSEESYASIEQEAASVVGRLGNAVAEKDVKINKLYFARHSEKKLYRARVLRKSDQNRFNCYFVDCGVEKNVKELYTIKDSSIAAIPPLAIKCALYNAPSEREVLQKLNQDFEKFLKNVNNKIQVSMIEPGVKSARIDVLVDEKKSYINECFAETESQKDQNLSVFD